MPAGLPIELRRRIVSAHVDQGLSKEEIAELFGVGRTTVNRYLEKAARGESLEPRFAPGPRSKLGAKELAWLKKSIAKNPYVTSYELAALYNRRFKKNQVHRSTILRAMHQLGFTHKKRPK